MFSPKMLENCHFEPQVPNFGRKKLWIHVTIGSCSTLVWKDVEKIQKNSPCRLQDISIWIDKNLFIGPTNTGQLHSTRVTFVWKNIQNGSYCLDSFFKASWLHAWKNSDHLELFNMHYKKLVFYVVFQRNESSFRWHQCFTILSLWKVDFCWCWKRCGDVRAKTSGW